jgi:hypothetical protein
MKTCKDCGETKPLDCFNKNRGNQCKPCQKEYNAQRYQAKREQILEQNAQWRKDNPEYHAEYNNSEAGKAAQTKYRTKIEPGIYQIINKQTGCRYIGQSEIPNKRRTKHWTYLRGGYHGNPPLQQAYNKYGEDAFIFEMIEHCEPDQLLKREAYWISKYKDCCYNIK